MQRVYKEQGECTVHVCEEPGDECTMRVQSKESSATYVRRTGIAVRGCEEPVNQCNMCVKSQEISATCV